MSGISHENIDLMISECKRFGVELSDDTILKLQNYKDLLLEWNEKFNLTRIVDERDLVIKHFVDSLSLLSLSEFREKKTVLDIGSGAGFPGIPIKIAEDKLNITLLDSLGKRVTFLNAVIKELELGKIEAIHGRAEELARKPNYRESFDIVTSRAVARLDTLSEYALPFVKVGGLFVAMKGSEVAEEVEEATKAIKILGGECVETKHILLDGEIDHSLVIIKKIKKCDKTYPRAGGKPKSKPL